MFVALDATYSVDPHPSGIAVYSRELLNGLARNHADDTFLHLYRLKQYRRRSPPRFTNVRDGLLLPPILPAGILRKPDLFHALNQRVDRRIARHVVSTFHDLFVMSGEYSSADFRARFSRQAQEAVKRSDLIIAVSEYTKGQLVSYLNVEPERIRVVAHGVNIPKHVVPLEQRAKIILCVGALQLRKNITRLVEAFELLAAEIRNEWTLMLAGSTAGFGAAEILARAESSRYASQIQIRGYVSGAELREIYQRASVFAFPSLDEGFGIPVLEAMAHGIPVLTSNRSALREVAGNASVLVDPFDSEAMSHGLARLMTDESLRESLRTVGFDRANLFPWAKAAEATYAVYSELKNS